MDWKEQLAKLSASGTLPEGEPEAEVTAAQEEAPAKKATLHVLTDRKGRKGKTATIVEGFPEDGKEAEEVAARLKKQLGCGGSSRCGEILIQGDCKQKVADLLRSWNYKVKF